MFDNCHPIRRRHGSLKIVIHSLNFDATAYDVIGADGQPLGLSAAAPRRSGMRPRALGPRRSPPRVTAYPR